MPEKIRVLFCFLHLCSSMVSPQLKDPSKMDKLVSSIKKLKYNADIVYNLTCFFDDQLIVWNDSEQCLYFCKLNEHCEISDIHVVTLQKPPVFEITTLCLSPDGNYLALYGTGEVVVVELHRNLFHHRSEDQSIARSKSIGERMFLCNKKLKLLCLRWHPISKNHLLILNNDNCLRLFNVDDNYHPIKTINLNSKATYESHYERVSVYSNSLGENSVAFDFGPCLARFYSAALCDELKDIFPVYVLKGNGDVLLIHLSITDLAIADRIHGPLRMAPSAEDNYGTDACSILCMDCVPTIVVIGTSSGLLYHCVAMENDVDEEEKNLEDNAYSFVLSQGLHVVVPEIILYVLETIELSFSLTFSSHDSSNFLSDVLNTSLQLFMDIKDPKRYYCLHSFGVHIVMVSFFKQLTANLTEFYDDKSIIEYLICTRPSSQQAESDSTTEQAFPVGIALVLNQGFTYVTVLLNSSSLISKRIANVLLPSIDSECLIAKKSDNEFAKFMTTNSSSNNKNSANFFPEYISKILEKSTSLPLIKSSREKADKVGATDLEMLLNSIDVLRKEYIEKFALATKAIEKRKCFFKNDCKKQIEYLTRIKAEKDAILRDFAKLVDKYESVKDCQQDLSDRLEKIITEIQNQRPTLSDAELTLKEQLSKEEKNITIYKQKLEQIKQKHLYQDQFRKSLKNEESRTSEHFDSPMQVKIIQEVLEKQSKMISELIVSLKRKQLHDSKILY